MKRLLAIAIAFGLLLSIPRETSSQGVPITGLPVNPAPVGTDIFVMVHAGATMQSAISGFNTVFVDLISAQNIGGNKTFTGSTTFLTPPSGVITTPVPTSLGGTGTSSPNPTCANPNCTLTGGWPSFVISVVTPTPGPSPAPSPTCATTTCSFAGSTLTVNQKPMYFYSWSTSGALTTGAFPWVPLTYNEALIVAVADQAVCPTPGTVGTNTVKWQYTTADPYTGSPTITDIPNSSMSWTTAGGTAANAISPTFNLSAVVALYVRPNVTAVGASPPSNCSFMLHVLH